MRYKITNTNRKVDFITSKIKKFISYIIFTLVVIFSISLYRNLVKLHGAQSRIQTAQNSLENLKVENEQLEEKIKYAESEEYVETQIRDKLGSSLEGETVIILPDPEIVKKYAPKDAEENKELTKKANWRKWMMVFGL